MIIMMKDFWMAFSAGPRHDVTMNDVINWMSSSSVYDSTHSHAHSRCASSCKHLLNLCVNYTLFGNRKKRKTLLKVNIHSTQMNNYFCSKLFWAALWWVELYCIFHYLDLFCFVFMDTSKMIISDESLDAFLIWPKRELKTIIFYSASIILKMRIGAITAFRNIKIFHLIRKHLEGQG